MLLDKIAPKEIELKVSAQVMLLRNKMDLDLVNGSRGVIVGFSNNDTPRVKFDTGDEMCVTPLEYETPLTADGCLSRMQVPLKLAW